MSPSERLIRLHEMNRREEVAQAREVSGLVAFVVIGIFLAFLFHVVVIIGSTPV